MTTAMKTIIWDSDEREIPGYCVARRGDVLTLPWLMAKSYVDQGKAREKVTPKKSTIKKEEEIK